MKYSQFFATVVAVIFAVEIVLFMFYFSQNVMGVDDPCRIMLPTAGVILDCQATREAAKEWK